MDGITPWVFGGVARLSTEPRTAAAELRIALAGPVVSLVIAATLLAPRHTRSLPGRCRRRCLLVGSSNIALLTFNLRPAFPLDGGRVVR